MSDRPPSTNAEIALAALTSLIFVTYLTSNYFLWKQSVIGKNSADAATSAANTAKAALAAGNQTASDTLGQMKTQSTAMKDAAGAAKAQVVTNRRALDATIAASRLDQRAWIGLADFITVNPLLSAEGMKFSVDGVKLTIRNSGKTPGIHLSIVILETGRVFSDPVRDFDEINEINPGIRIVEEGAFPRGQVLAPGVDLKYPLGGIFQPARDDRGRNITQYILGKITYNDIFEGTRQRTTKFCLMSLRPNIEYRPCPKGNSMD
jgi:hypothetical protein